MLGLVQIKNLTIAGSHLCKPLTFYGPLHNYCKDTTQVKSICQYSVFSTNVFRFKSSEAKENILKASFNNVFTLTNLSCMSLHAISVFDKVYKWSPEKTLHLKSTIKCFKEVKIDKLPDLSYSFLTIDCCVRINGEPDRSFSGDIQS